MMPYLSTEKPKLSELGAVCLDAKAEHIAENMGLHSYPWQDILTLVNATFLKSGTCTTPKRGDHESYAHWLVKVLMVVYCGGLYRLYGLNCCCLHPLG